MTCRRASALLLLTLIVVRSPAASAAVPVLTYHDDNARTGQNVQETVLTPGNVTSAQFGRLFQQHVDGYVYAQPLIVPNVDVPGRGVHTVVYVATERDTVYAFDADAKQKGLLWKARLLDHSVGAKPVSSKDEACDDLVPEIGITSTPVIDASSATLYVVTKSKEHGDTFVQRLHALDLATGFEKLGGPVVLTASVPGTGDGSVGGMVTFDPFREHQRAGLLLANGNVYIGWASHCDHGPYHGWVMAYDATTLHQVAAFNTTPDGGLGGVWQSGGAPAADDTGNLYFETGNGTFDADVGGNDLGDSLVKLTPGLGLADYFTPFDQDQLNMTDADLGSGGPVLLPDQSGPHTQLAVGCGKEGTIYLVDRDAMGHFHSGDDSQIVQSLPSAIGGTWSLPAYWNGNVYYLGAGDVLKAFALSAGTLSTSPVSQAGSGFGFPGATPSVSSNGASDGIVWALQTDAYGSKNGSAVLHAYDATDVSTELYNSAQVPRRDNPGKPVKFAVPTVANGKVYVGTQKRLSVYGLL